MYTDKKNVKKDVRKNNVKKFKVKNTGSKLDDQISVIIIDDQFDFGDPNGALYVPGGENINKPILDYIKANRNKINQVILTRDHHPKNHMSFKENGGQWPAHCVQGSDGEKIVKELQDGLVEMHMPFTVVDKGTVANREEYGAFEHLATFHHLHPNDPPHVKNCYFANCESSSGCRIINNNIVVCGIAGDYCVMETMKNLIKHWKKFNISVLMDGTASIDGGVALNDFINSHDNIKAI